ncbi:hypothetical protein LJC36_03980, partial [Desulfovibrio sp. OttesenSCG-928-C14]|nr:hypothetical protein [Desulfovibrio sp. OttesenSCG-928-C14]
MSFVGKLFKGAAQIIHDSGITTCYSTPEARQNRVPAYFEQLEPRQLLDAAQHDPDEYSTSSTVVAENFSLDPGSILDTIKDLPSLFKEASLPDFSSINLGDFLDKIPGLDSLADFDFSSLGDKFEDLLGVQFEGSEGGAKLRTGNDGFFMSLFKDTVSIAGDFIGTGANTLILFACGDVTLENVSFKSLSNVLIWGGDITFGENVYMDSNVTIAGTGDIIFKNNATISGDADPAAKQGNLNLATRDTIIFESGAKVQNIKDLILTAPGIEITGADINISGNFSAVASVESGVHPLLGIFPIKVAQGDVSISVENSVIKAGGSMTLDAKISTTTKTEKLNISELTDNQALSMISKLFLDTSIAQTIQDFLGVEVSQLDGVLKFAGDKAPAGSEYLKLLSQPLSSTLQEIYNSLAVGGPFVVTYASAEANINVSGSTTLEGGDNVAITAGATVSNTQTKDANLFGLMLGINKANAEINISGTTSITSKDGDVKVEALTENTNSLTLKVKYDPASDPGNQPPLFNTKPSGTGSGTGGTQTTTKQRTKEAYAMAIALGINDAQAKVMIGSGVTLSAGRDIIVNAATKAKLVTSASSNATVAGNLGVAVALQFGDSTSYVQMDGQALAQGSVYLTSKSDVTLNLTSSTNLPSDPAAPQTTPPQEGEQNSIDQTKGKLEAASKKVSDTLTKLVLTILPMGAVVEQLQKNGMGLGLALGFELNDTTAETVIGKNAVITAHGAVKSGAGGTGEVVLTSEANTTPVMTVSAVSNLDPFSYAPTESLSDGGKPVEVDGKNITTGILAAAAQFIQPNHGFVVGDKVYYTQSDAAARLSLLDNLLGFSGSDKDLVGQIFTVTAAGSDYFELSYTDYSTGRQQKLKLNDLSEAAKNAKHSFTKFAAGSIAITGSGTAPAVGTTPGGPAFTAPGHGLAAGDLVTFKTNDGAMTSLLGTNSLVKDNTYKVKGVSGDFVMLTTLDGVDVAVPTMAYRGSEAFFLVKVMPKAGTINVTRDKINSTNGQFTATAHGFTNNDTVTYSLLGGSTALNGLTSGKDYKVKVIDANTFQLLNENGTAITSFTAESGKSAVHVFTRKAAPQQDVPAVTVKGSEITAGSARVECGAHNFKLGDVLTYTSTSPLGGVGNNQLLKITQVGTGWFSFSLLDGATPNLSISGAAQSANHTFTKTDDPSAQPKVDVKNADISANKFNAANKFTAGDVLTYTFTGTALTGLTANASYTVLEAGANFFTLKGTDGKVMTITAGTDTTSVHTFTKKAAPGATQVVVHGSQVANEGSSGNKFTYQNVPFKMGDEVTYSVLAGGTAITGLTVGSTYRIKEVGAGYFRLADANNNLLTISLSEAAKTSSHVFTKGAAPTVTQKLKGVNIAVGVAVLSNTAKTTVGDGAKITSRFLLDVDSKAQFLAPTNTKASMAAYNKFNSLTGGAAGKVLGLDFLSGLNESVKSVTGSIDQSYLDGQEYIGELLGVDAVNFNNSGSNFLTTNSYVYASTEGAKDSAIAGSIAYIGQDNKAESIIGKDVTLIKTGALADSAVSGNAVALGDLDAAYYNGKSNWVTYEVEQGAAAISGLTAGQTYWGVVDTDGKLALYAADKTSRITVDPTSGNSNAVHYFIFADSYSSSGAEFAPEYNSESSVLEFTEEHGFYTGDIVTYNKLDADDRGLGAGFASGDKFMVVAVSNTAFSLKKIDDSGKISDDFAIFKDVGEIDHVLFAKVGESAREGSELVISNADYEKENKNLSSRLAGFKTGDTVRLGMGSMTGPSYTITLIGANGFMLQDASNNYVDLSSIISGTDSFSLTKLESGQPSGQGVIFTAQDLSFGTVGKGKNPSASFVATGNTITSSEDWAKTLRGGDIVEYTASDPAKAIPGLVSGQKYYVALVDEGVFALRALDAEGNPSGAFIELGRKTGAASNATHSFKVTQAGGQAEIIVDKTEHVSDDKNVFFIGSHSFQTGDRVVYQALSYGSNGQPQVDGNGNLVYTSLGEYTLLRISDSSIKLRDARGNYLEAPDLLSGSGYDDYRLSLVASGSVVATDAADGGKLKVLSGSFGQGEQVVYTALEGAVASGLANGSSYFVLSVSANGDGTDTITLGRGASGPAISVSTGAGLHSLTLSQARSYTAGNISGDGEINLGQSSGLYSGVEISFDGQGNDKILAGQSYYLRVLGDGLVMLADSYENFLAGNFLSAADLAGLNSGFRLAGEVHGFSQETLNLGRALITTAQPHQLSNGGILTLTRNGVDYYYTVTTYGEYGFTLASASSGELVTPAALLGGEDSVSLSRSVSSVLASSAEIVQSSGQDNFLRQDNHGFVTGTKIQHVVGSGTDAKTTEYYVVLRDDNTFYLAESLSDARAGIILTTQISGGTLKAAPARYGIFVNAETVDKTINITGHMDTGKGKIKTQAPTSAGGFLADPKTSLNNKLFPPRAPASGSGAGAALQILNLSNAAKAVVGGMTEGGKGSLIVADSLSVTSSNTNAVVTLLKSGATGEMEGLAGTIGFIYLNNDTVATVDASGSRIALGNAPGADKDSSLRISAKDHSIYTQISGTISSGESAMGGTVFVQVVNRDTDAKLLGSKELGSVNFGGRISVLGKASAEAINSGRGVTILIGGSHASTAQKEEAQTAAGGKDGQNPGSGTGTTPPPTDGTGGTGGTVSNLMTQVGPLLNAIMGTQNQNPNPNPDPNQNSGPNTELITQAPAKISGLIDKISYSVDSIKGVISSAKSGTKQDGKKGDQPNDVQEDPKVHKAFTGEIYVGYGSENTRVVIENLSTLVAAGFVARALNDTKQITAAGALAITTGEGSSDSMAGAGTFAISITDRDTSAHVSNVGNIKITGGDFNLEAQDDGMAVIVAAGLAGSTSGSGYGGTLLVNTRLTNVAASIASSDLSIEQGGLQVHAFNNATLITVAGGGGFGAGKGVGLA